MIPNNLILRIITRIENAGLNVPVVQGLRSEDLPAPCIAVHAQSAENFNKSFTDVYRGLVSCRYDEHYADNSSTVVKDNFDAIINQFSVDNISSELEGFGYQIFRVSIESCVSEIINDFFSNEILLEIIYERETNGLL